MKCAADLLVACEEKWSQLLQEFGGSTDAANHAFGIETVRELYVKLECMGDHDDETHDNCQGLGCCDQAGKNPS
jgi:hypothetical protein